MNTLRNFFCCSRRNYNTSLENTGVYRLRLSKDKYYIGKSNDINKRIYQHKQDGGSYWTRKFPVIERIPTLTNSNNSPFWELEETLENICEFGIDNVRGSFFSKISLNRQDRILAAQLYCEMHDLCKKCGSNDHFIKDCVIDHLEEWVYKFGGELSLHSKFCKRCKKNIGHLPDHYRYCEGCFGIY